MAQLWRYNWGKAEARRKPASKTFRPYDTEQMFLMPASMWEWLSCGHLAYFISDVVNQLELSEIMRSVATHTIIP